MYCYTNVIRCVLYFCVDITASSAFSPLRNWVRRRLQNCLNRNCNENIQRKIPLFNYCNQCQNELGADMIQMFVRLLKRSYTHTHARARAHTHTHTHVHLQILYIHRRLLFKSIKLNFVYYYYQCFLVFFLFFFLFQTRKLGENLTKSTLI